MAGAVVTVVVGVRHVRTGGARSDDVVRRIWRAHVGLECEQAQAIVSNHRCTGREGYVVCIVEYSRADAGCVGLHSGGNCLNVESEVTHRYTGQPTKRGAERQSVSCSRD